MDSGVKIAIIAAVAENGVIGRNGDVPWRLKSDLQRFKRLTYGKTVIVGRKTHESILRRLGHPLEGRRMIILTRQPNYSAPAGCEVVASWEEALTRARGTGEVFVIGGAEVYRIAKPYAAAVYLTEVHAWPNGDAYFHFPEYYDTSVLWREVIVERYPRDAENEYDHTFKVLQRRAQTSTATHGDPPPATYVHLEHARHDDQRVIMQRIAEEGICPFCPENRKTSEVLEPLWQGKHWVLVPNRWPYRFTTLHLLAVPERHMWMLSELTTEEWSELHTLIAWTEAKYHIDGGSIGIRFGNPALTGATVEHLHVHLIVADPDATKPGYERVRFPMGPKPREKKAPDA